MDWEKFWNERGDASQPMQQVARTGGDDKILDEIAVRIIEALDIKGTDDVLDVCCGNGLLTSRIGERCKTITGVDFSEVLIEKAKENFPKYEFICADALNLDSTIFNKQYDKIYLYFSFQYFETYDKGKHVIENLLKLLKPNGLLLLGDIPDRAKFFVYYNSPQRLWQLFKQLLQNKNDMGKFWSEDEMRLISEQLKTKSVWLKQPNTLPYAHYRFDFLIEKK